MPTFIFDVDGVLNSAADYRPNKQVISKIASLLNSGAYIAINTGRGYAWVRDNVIDGIRSRVAADKRNNIFIVAEMGGVSVEYLDEAEHESRSTFGLTTEQIQQIKQVYDTRSMSQNVEWYEGKLSMATIYKPFGISSPTFIVEAQEIASELRSLFAADSVKISISSDSLDVMSPSAGKWTGARLIYHWLQRTSVVVGQHFVCFGDNTSDYEMARFLGLQGHTVEFVFTGVSLDQLERDEHVTFSKTDKPYYEGTLAYLRKVTSS